MEKKLKSALDLLRRQPPQKIEENVKAVLNLVPELTDDVLCSVDQPLKTATDPDTGAEYLLCDYNRDGDSHRSPWSNKFYPPASDEAVLPTGELRDLEVALNDAFSIYRHLYYDGGVSSVYCWELDNPREFAACVLIKKKADQNKLEGGQWDSTHIIEARPESNKFRYTMTSSIMLYLETNKVGSFSLAGTMTRRVEKEMVVDSSNSHIKNMGRLVEDIENQMRGQLNDVYFHTTHSIMSMIHSNGGFTLQRAAARRQADIRDSMHGSRNAAPPS